MELSTVVLMLAILIFYFVLGTAMDTFGMLILSLPFVMPVIDAHGINHIWFGIFVGVMVELAAVSPPVGITVAVMRAVAGIAPDFTVKLGWLANFDAGDPANLPPAGYLWTNAIAAGIAVRNYGVLVRNGQAMDPAIRPFTKPDAAAFLEDLKQFETSGMMPRLIFIADPTGGESVKAAIARSRFASDTQVVLGDLARAEALLGLRPMTLKD